MEGAKEFFIQKYCCPALNCCKEYKSKFNLKHHYQHKHLGIWRFFCQICNKKFANASTLQEHLFIHTGEKPFKCRICGARFRQSSLLSLHKRSHTSNYMETLNYVENKD
jgi:uncharacterized Zn-finger protein